MFRIKVCGITNWTDARRAIEGGCDALGFNFYPRSPRYIEPARARRIAARLPRGVAAVGVFVNEPLEAVLRIARQVGLDYVQLHGDETPALLADVSLCVPAIKAFRVAPGFRAASLQKYRRAAAFLLDGFHPRLRGGTGRTVDWSLARRAGRYGPIVLAGGLRPDNVAEAIRSARPAAVDVSSGVESAPGRKDRVKLREFIEAALSASGAFA
jgi:phosphoribosylanthranilate isomerase